MLRKKKDYEFRIELLEKKVAELEQMLQAVKEISGVKRQTDDIKKKQKWLNSYPDETAPKEG